MIERKKLEKLITDTLKSIGLYSDEALYLILGTIAKESLMGKYRKQIGGGPALGICQIEPSTFYDIIQHFLKYNPMLKNLVMKEAGVEDLMAEYLENNDVLSICFCRFQYRRYPEKLPKIHDIEGMAALWKKRYNTYKGSGTVDGFIKTYEKYIKNG